LIHLAHLVRASVFFYGSAPPHELHSFLHDALPISRPRRGGALEGGARSLPRRERDHHARHQAAALRCGRRCGDEARATGTGDARSEEHTSELQSRFDLVCRLLLEKKKKYIPTNDVT